MFLSYFVIIVTQFLLWTANCLVGNLKIGTPSALTPRCDDRRLEEPRMCGPACPIACDTLNMNVCCDVKCVTGCFCRDGYILLSSKGPQKCVRMDDCPKPGVLEFGNLTVTVLESARMVTVVILRLHGSAGEIAVKWRTVEDSAKSGSDFVPSSGTLVFPDGVLHRALTIEIVDDSIREPDERFTVVLSDPTNRAEINPRRLDGVSVTIKDDDMRPGYIQVLNNSVSIPENYGTVLITLVRVGGVDGMITVHYRTVDGTARSQIDYAPVSGIIDFNEGEVRKTVQVAIINDENREPIENFQLEFYDPTSAAINFRQMSSSLATIVTITDDDMTPGYIEFDMPRVTVVENVGTVNMTLVRLGGSDGQIRIKYRTVDGTTGGNADYVPIMGEVAFDEGETRKVISLNIVDDDLKEPAENFKLQLYDPSAAPDVINFRSLGNRLESTIFIMDNDMKPGYIELPNPVVTISESIGAFKLNVVRVGGQDGEIRIRYRTVDGTAASSSDFGFLSGELVFKDGQTLQQIKIDIINDFVTEARESFRLELFDPSAASDVMNFRGLGGRTSTVITIVDDDMKPGYLELERVNATINENYGTLQIPVVRLEGADGILQMKYMTRDGTAIAGSDYESASGTLVFKDGERKKIISIPIFNDNVKETAESFQLQIYDITAGAETINFRSQGSKLSTVITILDDDRTPGYLEMEAPTVKAPESIGAVMIPVKRLGGSDGELRVKYITVDVTALAQSDYRPSSGIIVFNDGEIRQMISIPIINDRVKETVKTFQVKLIDLNPDLGQLGYRTLGSTLATTVSIIDDDRTPGYLEMEAPTVNAPEGIGAVMIPVKRLGGSDGELRVKYITVDVTALAQSDYRPSSGVIVFNDGEIRKMISIPIINDRVKETVKTFQVKLIDLNPDLGQLGYRTLGSTMATTVSIIDDDKTPGYIEMEAPTVNAPEGIGTVMIPVKRLGGSDGELRVKYITVDVTALAQSDYRQSSGVIVFNDGEVRKMISIPIINDRVKETVKTFQVKLIDLNPDLGQLGYRTLGSTMATTVSIIDDDRTPGYLEMEAPTVNAPEGIGTVMIPVKRLGGSDGELRVKYITVDVTALAQSDYRPSSGVIVFNDGEVRKMISIPIINDRVKETVKTFQVKLIDLNPDLGQLGYRTLGSTMATTVSIIDDDRTPGYLEMEAPTVNAPEGIGTVMIPVKRLGGSDGELRVKYITVDVTALAQSDYRQSSGVIVFNDGEVRKMISIPIINDRVKETVKTFQVKLIDLNPDLGQLGYRTLGSTMATTVSIIDDDNYPGVLEFQNVRISVLESVRTLSVTVIRREGSDGQVTLQVRTISRTATEGVDYNTPPPVLTFPDGVTEQTLQIQILDDNIKESNEEFFIGLFNPTNGGVLGGIKQMTVVIIDDDDPSIIRFERRSGNFRESDGVAEIPVVRENRLDRKVSVYWKIEDQSARAGEDYRRSSGDLLIFNSGEGRQNIRIEIMDDTIVENSEFFDVVLMYASEGAVLGVPSRFTVQLLDNDRKASTQPSVPSLPQGIQLSFRSQNIRVKENAGEVIIPIARSGSLIPISVQIKTEDGSAIGERDYKRTRGTVSFEFGDVELKIAIRIIDDHFPEPDKTFSVVLLNPTAGIILGLRVITVTIEDDDGYIMERRDGGGASAVVTSRPRSFPNPPPESFRPGLLTKCPEHLILKTCAHTCPPTCSSMHGKVPCSSGSGCIRGCFCPEGLVKESESSDRCIRPSEC